MRHRFQSVLLTLICCGCASRTPSLSQKISSIMPKDADFSFRAHEGWSTNLLKGVRLAETTAQDAAHEITKIMDGEPSTTWTGKGYGHKPEFTFDLGRTIEFNRLVIFNRHTDARGIGGGNNAARDLVISGSIPDQTDTFFVVCETTLPGPRAQCIEHEGRRACFFIDNTEPVVIKLPKTRVRLLRIQILSAYWTSSAESNWPSELSYALSEVMVFLAVESPDTR